MKKNIFLNFIKNMISYAMPVAILQFIVQPLIAGKLGEEKNGLFLTVIALNYFITSITASILLQTRLLQNEKYDKNKFVGDYNIILIVMAIFNSFAMAIGTYLYMGTDVSLIDIVLCVIMTLLFLLHDYICVQYRVELNYSRILVSNIVLCIGYVIGIIVFLNFCSKWQLVFIIAYVLCEIYDLSVTTYIREPLKLTPLFNNTLKRYFILAGASVISYLVSYGDRLILFPLTDGTTVSIFTAAEIMGKMLMLLSTPLSGFLLSYIVKEKELKLNINLKYGVAIAAFLIVIYMLCVGISVPLLHILYPKWASRSAVYVPLVTFTSLINLISHTLNVVVIRFCHSKWQIVINATYLFVYLSLSYVLLYFYGLIGFCIGNIIAAICKLLVIVIVGKNKKMKVQ